MPQYLLVLVLSAVMLSACGKKESANEPVVAPETPVVKTTPETPTFKIDIDDESAFDDALGAAPLEAANTFVEVVDDLDADSVQAAEPGEKIALALENDAQAQAESKIRAAAREENQALTSPTGLQIRPYSDELYVQVKGVKPAVLYFTGNDCETCKAWEKSIRADAEAYADTNALILLADIKAQADLASEFGISEPGFAMMLTGMGELMGPRPSDRLTQTDLSFIFQ